MGRGSSSCWEEEAALVNIESQVWAYSLLPTAQSFRDIIAQGTSGESQGHFQTILSAALDNLFRNISVMLF